MADEMSTQLPPEVKFGYIAGRFILGVSDGPDEDDKPDAKAAQGGGTFTPAVTLSKLSDPDPTTMIKKPIPFLLDKNGYVRDEQGNSPVALITGVWNVTYSVTGASLDKHLIEVKEGHTKSNPQWLTNAAPAGKPVTPSQYAELTARIDGIEADTTSAAQSAAAAATSEANAAQSAQDAADSMGGVTVTGTPDAGSLLVGVSGTEAKWQAPQWFLRGHGSPLNVVTPVGKGVEYRDLDQTLGARVWISTGTTSASWVVVDGDTGWIDITSIAAISSGSIAKLRTAQTVSISFLNVSVGPGVVAVLPPGALSGGFRPDGAQSSILSDSKTSAYRISFPSNGQVSLYGSTQTTHLNGSAMFPSTHPWPTSL